MIATIKKAKGIKGVKKGQEVKVLRTVLNKSLIEISENNTQWVDNDNLNIETDEN